MPSGEGFEPMEIGSNQRRKKDNFPLQLDIAGSWNLIQLYQLELFVVLVVGFLIVTFFSIDPKEFEALRTPQAFDMSARRVYTTFPELVHLRETLQTATQVSLSHNTHFPSKIALEHYDDHGVQVTLVRMVALSTSGKPKNNKPLTTDPSQAVNFVDPLDLRAMPSELVVQGLDDVLGLPYSVVLNKFNTVTDHALVLTNNFRAQVSPLTHDDLLAWYVAITATNAVGFFNSNRIAGASQPHKHMQIVPLDILWSMRLPDSTFPMMLDDLIQPRIEQREFLPLPAREHLSPREYHRYTYRIPEFDFRHAVIVLSDSFITDRGDLLAFYGEYLEAVYEALLDAVQIDKHLLLNCAENSQLHLDLFECEAALAYNVVLTERYMLLVPRSQRGVAEGTEVNAMGFLGLLLAKSPESEARWKAEGVFDVLKSVARPW